MFFTVALRYARRNILRVGSRYVENKTYIENSNNSTVINYVGYELITCTFNNCKIKVSF